MNRIIVIGDIHGCYDELQELIKKIGIKEEDTIISLGDILDRGPKSLEVYDYLINRPNTIVLMGNHERKHLKGILSYAQEIVKVQFGSRYQELIAWIKDLEYYYTTPNEIIVHAAFETDKKIEEQREDVLSGSTSGERYLEKKYEEGTYWQEYYQGDKAIIYGHHVVGEKPKYINNTIGIDTGSCHGDYLTAIILPSREIIQVKSRKDYWKEERIKWQLPVLESIDWMNMPIARIEQKLNKLAYIKDEQIQIYLEQKANWIKELDELCEAIKKGIDEECESMLIEYGQKKFNLEASQKPYKVFLFKSRKNDLKLDDIRSSLETPFKRIELAGRLGIKVDVK